MRSKPIAMHPEVVPWLASTYAIVFLQWVFKTSPIRHGTLCGTTICGYCGISLPFSHPTAPCTNPVLVSERLYSYRSAHATAAYEAICEAHKHMHVLHTVPFI